MSRTAGVSADERSRRRLICSSAAAHDRGRRTRARDDSTAAYAQFAVLVDPDKERRRGLNGGPEVDGADFTAAADDAAPVPGGS